MATTYMNLTLPVVSVTLGPEWATELNTALESIDAHDHTSGKGRLITVAALNIDDNLPMNGFVLENVPYLQVNTAASPVSGSGFENSLSTGSGDLYWTNGAGVAVQLTSGGTILSPAAALEKMQYDEVAVDLIIGSGDPYVVLNIDTSAARNITLPLAAAVDEGRLYVIKDGSNLSETNNITVAASGSDTIDGASTVTINSDGGAVFLIGNGVDGYKII